MVFFNAHLNSFLQQMVGYFEVVVKYFKTY